MAMGQPGIPSSAWLDSSPAGLDPVVILWYGYGMKTSISLPDELFASADALAKRLRTSRSELYATALAEYVAKHRDEQVTARLNAVHKDVSDGIEPAVRRAQARSLASDAW